MVPIEETGEIKLERRAHQSPDGQPDCEICSKILLYASEVDQACKALTLGTVKDLLASQCSHVALFKDWAQELLTDDPRLTQSFLAIVKDVYKHRFICFRMQCSPGSDVSHYLSGPVGLLRKLTVADHPGTMRAVDPQWIDVDLVKRWITTCDASHGDTCRQSSWLRHLEAVRPKYLIDTLEMCVIKGECVEAEYIALSYQWGQTKMLRNTIGVRERLLRRHSLSEWDFASHIPQTISDAIGAVRLLGYRYLWVDALCVTQDDHAELTAELHRMYRIYNCAKFTIVAADGSDANYGLRGLEGLTAARMHSQTPMQLDGSEQMVRRHPSRSSRGSRGGDTYHTRAWTFQEFHFSLRRLVFLEDAVIWHCQHGQMTEDVIREAPESDCFHYTSFLPPTIHQESRNTMPTLSLLAELARAFNVRELSFPEDALSAFAGIQSLLERIYQPGFLYGLPEFWFELALYWTPHGNLERRVASSSKSSVGSSYQLPSWSWIGWAGGISFPSVDCFADGDPVHGESFTEPVTKWYTVSHPTSPDRRPITSAWHVYRSRAMEDRSATLPKGWRPYSDVTQRTSFRHTRNWFGYSYPFPVPEPSTASVGASIPQTAYLSAQTSRAFLYGKPVNNWLIESPKRYALWLTSVQGQYVGTLRVNNAEEESFFKGAGSNSLSTKPLELIAISKGTSAFLLSPALDWDFEIKKLSKSSLYFASGFGPPIDCIYVLWIEWKDGVAYRRACGTVTAEAWEQAREREPVDLILG